MLPSQFLSIPAESGYSWSTPQTGAPPTPGEVHILIASSLDLIEKPLETILDHLPLDERDRSKKFLTIQDRLRYAAAHYMVRKILAQYLGVNSKELRLEYSSNGKPSIAEKLENRPIQFSLTHSHGVALCALVLDHEIGVDLEYVERSSKRLDKLADRILSDQEKTVYQSVSEDQKVTLFYRYWTIKEAFLKANGLGLAYPLKEIDISLKEQANSSFVSVRGDVREASRWHIRELGEGVLRGFAATVVIRDLSFPKIVLRRISEWDD